MKKLLLIFFLLFIIVLAAAYFKNPKTSLFSRNNTSSTKPTITIDNHTFILMLAKTEKERQLGLSGRDSMPQDTGMLFLFSNPDIYSFWMKDMRFPLDIIYIKNNKIVTIYSNLQNPTPKNQTWQIVKPIEPADTVLEIHAGLSNKYNFKVGDDTKTSL